MDHIRGILPFVGAAAVLAALAGCTATPAPTPTATHTQAPLPQPTPNQPADDFSVAAAEAYCTQHGGTVQSRQPTANTNGDQSQWVQLGTAVNVCRFQSTDADKSRIYLDLATLYDNRPTLAALAYLSKTPIPKTTNGNVNPSSVLCSALGGTTSYGSDINGGGLVNTSDPDDIVFSACTFADQSFIEAWGIAYYSQGTIRGTDLSKLFRFDQAGL